MEYIEDLVDIYKEPSSSGLVDQAKEIYKKIRENQRRFGKEYISAKKDLEYLGIETKGLTLNQLYLKHQSEMVNRIVLVLKGE